MSEKDRVSPSPWPDYQAVAPPRSITIPYLQCMACSVGTLHSALDGNAKVRVTGEEGGITETQQTAAAVRFEGFGTARCAL